MNHVTADTHFNHSNIIEFCDRPFRDVEEMNETLIVNWNSKVGENDTVYHVGDFGYGELGGILNRLNGEIIYIQSQEWSHEKAVLEHPDRFKRIVPILTIKKIKEYGVTITFCHYCMRTWPKSHYNHWHVFAHSHGRLEPIGKSWDVGVDNNNFFPLSFKELAKIMDGRPDNPNYVKLRGFYRQRTDEVPEE